MFRERVFVAECPDYDVGRIATVIRRAAAALGFTPRGAVFAKPNVVFAFRPEEYGHQHTFTNPAVIEAGLSFLANSPTVRQVELGEKSGMGVPTRLTFRHAGYFDVINRVAASAPVPVRPICMEEEPRSQVFIGGKVHDRVRLNQQMAAADTLVYLPKLKCHCVAKMTGAVKLNIGILSDDERAIRHDFLLDEKIADLYVPGNPQFVIMDAIEVGMGNEVLPAPRKLGLLGIARAARRLEPYDDEFYRWQEVDKELDRMGSPLQFYHGPYSANGPARCEYGCVMGLKMFLAVLERFSGIDSFARGKPQTIVVGRIDEPIDAGGEIAWMFGSCASARIENASEIIRVDKCFTTATDMFIATRNRMGIPNPFYSRLFLGGFIPAVARATGAKLLSGRYAEDVRYFLAQHLTRRM